MICGHSPCFAQAIFACTLPRAHEISSSAEYPTLAASCYGDWRMWEFDWSELTKGKWRDIASILSFRMADTLLSMFQDGPKILQSRLCLDKPRRFRMQDSFSRKL
jgi:hypothetical protein